MKRIAQQDDERLFLIAQAIRIGVTLEEIHDLTKIDYFFLRKIEKIVRLEEELKGETLESLSKSKLLTAKRMGFGDSAIARFLGTGEKELRVACARKCGILPSYRMVDTCSAEFEAVSPYYYSTYGEENEARALGK